jgi:hypothetical protein
MSEEAIDDAAAKSRDSVAQRLLASSTSFVRSAAAAYSSESWDVFYLHLATAVEQLVKAVLADANPSFIADTRTGFDSLLHLCGFGHRAKTPHFVSAVRTIGVSEAFERVGRLLDGYQQPPPRVRLLVETRDGVVHAGHRERGEAELILADTAQYIDQLLRAQGVSHQDYWGDAADMVADHTRRRLSAIEASYARRLQAARGRYAQMVSSMDLVGLGAYVAAAIPSAPRDTFDSALAKCPACGHEGELTGLPEPEWEADWDVADGQTYVIGAYVSKIHLRADGFRCRVCGLDLGQFELPFAGLGDVTLSEDEYDVTEATRFFEFQLTDEELGDY